MEVQESNPQSHDQESDTLTPTPTRQSKTSIKKQELTNWENILIAKNKECIINFEILLADQLTKKFFLNPAKGSRSAHIKISNRHQSVMG